MKELAAGLALLMTLLCGVFTWFTGPCELWTYSKAGNVPARCASR
ncbi:hypothetical protein [Micromonospora sp. NPDC048839]